MILSGSREGSSSHFVSRIRRSEEKTEIREAALLEYARANHYSTMYIVKQNGAVCRSLCATNVPSHLEDVLIHPTLVVEGQ